MPLLDKESPVPLYYQIQNIIRQEITSAQLEPGDRIDSEGEFARRYGVTRMTVRHALDALEREGLLRRERGRGTFVAKPKVQQNLVRFAGTMEDLEERAVQPTVHLLGVDRMPVPGSVAEKLEVQAGTMVWVVRRLRLADGEPMVIKVNYLSCDRFPDLDRKDLTGRLMYEIFEQDYGFLVAGARQEVEVASATPEEARLLGVPARSPVAVWHGRVFTPERVILEYVRSVYRGDKFRFYIEQMRQP